MEDSGNLSSQSSKLFWKYGTFRHPAGSTGTHFSSEGYILSVCWLQGFPVTLLLYNIFSLTYVITSHFINIEGQIKVLLYIQRFGVSYTTCFSKKMSRWEKLAKRNLRMKQNHTMQKDLLCHFWTLKVYLEKYTNWNSYCRKIIEDFNISSVII